MAFSFWTHNPTDTQSTAGNTIVHGTTIALATLTYILCEVVRYLGTDSCVPNGESP